MSRKIIIVDDQPVFRQSLKVTLQSAGDIEIIGEANNGEEFLSLLKTKNPEIVFMDIEMPMMNGIQATQKALKLYPGLLIIGLSLYDNPAYIDKLIEAGARGYLLKTSDNHELFKNIIKYPDAEIFFSEDISHKPDLAKNAVKTILLVDDFETNVIVMKSSLQIAGFNVKTANNPFIALKELEDTEARIDLIVVDYRMPGMNGAQLVAEIRKMEKYKRIPILMLSSETAPEKKQEAKNAGATGWIAKPFQLDKFLRIIEKAL